MSATTLFRSNSVQGNDEPNTIAASSSISSTEPIRRKRPVLSRVLLSGGKTKELSASNDSLSSTASSSSSSGVTARSTFGSDDETTQDGQSEPPSREWSDEEVDSRKRPRTISSLSLAAEKAESQAIFDPAELECSQQGSTTSRSQLASRSGLVIEGRYELVGDGKECKAVDLITNTLYHCLVMKPREYTSMQTLLARLEEARLAFGKQLEDFDEMKNLIVPDGVKLIHREALWYALLPDHFGNLHSVLPTTTPSVLDFSSAAASGGTAKKGDTLSERRIQSLFKQIVAMLNFCHRAGIHFRDLRLKKFVFTDADQTLLRLNSPLDVTVSREMNSIVITPQLAPIGIPRFITPEHLMGKQYDGKAADVWALGVLLFVLLMGRWPFYESSSSPEMLFRRIRARRFSFPVNECISPNARWLLHALLRLNPCERPSTVHILRSHWLRCDLAQLPSAEAGQKKTVFTTASEGVRGPPVFVSATRDHDYLQSSRESQPLQWADQPSLLVVNSSRGSTPARGISPILGSGGNVTHPTPAPSCQANRPSPTDQLVPDI